MSGKVTHLKSVGPVGTAFLNSDAFIKIIIGPVGSAKSMLQLQSGLRVAMMQKGKRNDQGVVCRKSRIAVVRETYPAIEKNILPSWERLVPRSVGKFINSAPYSHRFKKALAVDPDDNRRVTDYADVTFEFRAIGESNDIQSVMRSWEINSLIGDEADILPKELVSYGSGRVGRFSDLDPRTVVCPQIILGSNMPYENNWLFEMAFGGSFGAEMSEQERADIAEMLGGRPMVETFLQPAGTHPDAENLDNLPGGRKYYQIQSALNRDSDPDYVERMIENKPVPRRYGQPVYADFQYSIHRAKEPLKYDPSRPLIIGMDQETYAAAVFMQYTRESQLRVLREVVKFKDKNQKVLKKLGAVEFGKLVAVMLNDLAPDIDPERLIIRADPAAFQAKDLNDPERDWVRLVQAQLPQGCKIRRAKTNSPVLRQEAVRKHQSVIGGYLVDPSCTTLIAAHMGKYHFVKDEMASGEARGALPVLKNLWSNVADAEQYGALEGEHIIADLQGKPRRNANARGRVGYGNGYFSGRDRNVSSW